MRYHYAVRSGSGIDFFSIIIIILLCFIAYMLYTQQHGPIKLKKKETALDILKRRYANNEITKEEFEQMKKDIID